MTNTNTINGYDFHCHVDLFPDPPALIEQCEREGIVVLAVTTTPLAWSQNWAWTKNSPFVHSAVGLHPELVGERFAEAGMLEELIGQCRLVGEVGLDGSPQHRRSYDQQIKVFARVLMAANAHSGRLLTIHSRRAASDVISLITEHADPETVTCILHWFSGSKTDMRRASEIGCYFSVNQPMLSSDRGRALVRAMPSHRLLTETDAPFVKIGGQPSNPVSTKGLLSTLAEVRCEPVDSLSAQIAENAEKVFASAGISLG